MELKPEPTPQTQEHETKKPYHQPQVTEFGNIREITKNIGPRGALDGGGGAAAGPKTGT